jgi:flagellar protein FlgJ
MTPPIPALPAATDAASASATAAASGAAAYSDLNALSALKASTSAPQTLHAVAQQVDALFLQMMLKSMREASADVGDPESNEMGMYEDLFDKQVALTMSQHQDLGLGALLLRQQGAAAATGGAPSSASTAGVAAPTGVASNAGVTAPGTAQDEQSPGQFVASVLPAIRAAADALGVNPLGMLAQAALESGWGRRMARTANGASSLNLFGVKADDAWVGARATAATVEFSDGVATPRRTAFRAYGSIAESVGDFARLVGTSPRYRDAIAAGADAQAYVQGIAKSGYATDPEYAAKLTAMLQSTTFRQAVAASGVRL